MVPQGAAWTIADKFQNPVISADDAYLDHSQAQARADHMNSEVSTRYREAR